MLEKMTILSALLALILFDLVKAGDIPVPEVTRAEQSRDPSVEPSTELPLDYSRDRYKEEGTEQAGNTGVQGEQATWELSGEPSTELTLKPSVEPSTEPTQESITEIPE